MAAIDMQVFDLVCRDIASFQQVGKKIGSVSLNLSAAQFSDINLVEKLQSVIRRWKLVDCLIEFDIAEAIVMRDPLHSGQQLSSLKTAGFKLSIDHFGMGSVSLGCLQNLPVDRLIIDRSLLRGALKEEAGTSLIATIAAMAQSLGLTLTAVGVETPAQLQVLTLAGCDEYQGYYFSKAVPAQSISALIQ